MLKILLAVDGSESAVRAARKLVETTVHAHGTGCNMIYMGTRGMTALSNVVTGSTATRVLHLADVPVVLVH